MKHKILIPEDLTEVKLDNLIKFSKVDKEDELQLTIKAFAFFCDTPYSIVKALPIHFVNEVLGEINKVLTTAMPDRDRFTMDGVEYGRIPNLNKISLDEYAELDTFITPLYKDEIKHEDAFRFLSVLYRPIKDEVKGLYRIVDYDEEYINQEHWVKFKEHCPADIYVNSVGFFLSLRIELQKVSRSFLLRQGEKHPKHEKHLVKIGVGMEVCTNMLKDNLKAFKNQAKIMFSLPFLFCHTKQIVEN